MTFHAVRENDALRSFPQMPAGYVYRILAAPFFILASAAAGAQHRPALEQITRHNGDLFIGYAIEDRNDRLILKVERLIILGANTTSVSVNGGVKMLTHKDGSLFSGRFQILETGDYFLNETLYPGKFELPKGAIRERKNIENTASGENGHIVAFRGKHLIYSEDGSYKEGILPEEYTRPIAPAAPKGLAFGTLRVGYSQTTSQIQTLLPSLWSAALGYARQTKDILPWMYRWVPWFYAEVGGLYAQKTSYSALGVFAAAGPQWLLRFGNRHLIALQTLAGMNFLRVRDLTIDQAHISPAVFAYLGYGYRMDGYLLSAFAGYTYVHDSEAPLVGLGIHAAFAKTFGEWN